MNILSDSTPVSEAKEVWEPSWNVGMEAVKDPPEAPKARKSVRDFRKLAEFSC